MTEHPSNFDLEAWRVGERSEQVGAHLRECHECTQYISELDKHRERFLQAEPPELFLHRPAIRATLGDSAATRHAKATPRQPAWTLSFFLGWIGAPALVTAGIVVALVTGPTRQDVPDVVTVKGAPITLAAIRLRGGEQARLVGEVEVRPGDKLRFHLVVGAASAIRLVILDDDGTLSELANRAFQPGEYWVPDDSIEVTAAARGAWVLAGEPERVAHAIASPDQSEVATCRLLVP